MSDFEFEYEGKQYAFDLEDITFEQAMTIQKEVDLTLGEFFEMANGGGRRGDARFIHTMLWLGKQGAGEACRFADLKSMSPFKVAQQSKQQPAEPAKDSTAPSRKAADPTSSGGRTRKARTTATSSRSASTSR
ncbi:MAG TPA: hypothetical protein VHX38_02150 [Pseudonocardiaceae bacterium]|jgi:hypothetical protein|nr:hypothetical protein [Pseudonocardiaceae bacterium]